MTAGSGGKRQAELLKARPPADRLLVQAHARKETLDQHVAHFLAGDFDLHARRRSAASPSRAG